ncbi:MAG TPA: ribose-phosphate diphosphokinase [Sphingomonadales bacterium]|nr:ribose-phosphate diphosphokinase [Sphingomonadales bacterium]
MEHVKKAVFAFPEVEDEAGRLAKKLAVPLGFIDLHFFPDGESRVTVPFTADHAILYQPLHNANLKLFPVIQALSALKAREDVTIAFVCPYLPYMRQDKVFRDGQAFSQKVFAKVISPWIDSLITVEPHLHRSRSMDTVFPDITGIALSGGEIMAGYFSRKRVDKNTLVLGPDEEAWHTAKPFAEALKLDWTTAVKKRKGDRDVEVDIEGKDLKGRPVIIVDDVISSGMTVFQTAKKAYDLGAGSVEVAVVHALANNQTLEALRQAGVAWVVSCDGVPHETNKIQLAPALAKACKGL